jgi:hypothetical protein
VAPGNLHDCAAQACKIRTRFLYVIADFGTNFNLRTQKFRCNLLAQYLLALGQYGLRRVNDEATRFQVDEEILFFDAHCELRFIARHVQPSP